MFIAGIILALSEGSVAFLLAGFVAMLTFSAFGLITEAAETYLEKNKPKATVQPTKTTNSLFNADSSLNK